MPKMSSCSSAWRANSCQLDGDTIAAAPSFSGVAISSRCGLLVGIQPEGLTPVQCLMMRRRRSLFADLPAKRSVEAAEARRHIVEIRADFRNPCFGFIQQPYGI